MLSKVSLSDMVAEMNSNDELFNYSDPDHQTFFRFISYVSIIEEELDHKNLLLKIPSIALCVISIINLKQAENVSPLSIRIKKSWFENLPQCIKEIVESEIACPKLTLKVLSKIAQPSTESKSPSTNIRTSPKRPISKEYVTKQSSPPEHPRKKKNNPNGKLSFLKNIGKRDTVEPIQTKNSNKSDFTF